MGDITWIKLKTDMFENEKIREIESQPSGDTVLVIWFKLIGLSHRANAKGFIVLEKDIPLNIEEISTLIKRPINIVRYSISVLCRLQMVEMDRNELIHIVNWESYLIPDCKKVKGIG
ncbi:phage replisome organizer N-terminal domain-containing protein [Sporolactobacillus sp. STCC-11]|uniref:phage replisome organizer N-terminal domain-containing protein n=1 Tax=Sporolactobacillus caesalpiniae TaxID=3230362 RepID=UPI0033918760